MSPADHAILLAASVLGPAWVRSRRNVYRKAAVPLSPRERAALGPFFNAETLADARVARVERFQRWPMESALARVGFRGLLDSQSIAGIALVDTVVLVVPAARARRLAPISLLFHELVHLEQYRVFGVRGFIRRYIGSWLESGRSYADIGFEEQAYRLTERFEAEPSRPFSVAAAISGSED